ncbi:hypothetical protein AOQ84DRAFT_221474 [Glonium stellatum]|uniref:Uncharacterized protein n=1 Tax=Glonium stellatum TaxID=574774 RepID=A0A8E2FCQ9_9PEZI|nr:hypothetical protein AOQ84DRAFT_221474 [Glonium stellatum]
MAQWHNAAGMTGPADCALRLRAFVTIEPHSTNHQKIIATTTATTNPAFFPARLSVILSATLPAILSATLPATLSATLPAILSATLPALCPLSACTLPAPCLALPTLLHATVKSKLAKSVQIGPNRSKSVQVRRLSITLSLPVQSPTASRTRHHDSHQRNMHH